MKKALLSLLMLLIASQMSFGQSIQKVLIEEHTGAWCGYCPDGALILEDVLAAHPNAIAASVHNSDAMYISTGSLITSFYNPAFPQATINRSGAPVSRGSWNAQVTTALQQTPIVAVSIDSAGYDFLTHQLKVKIKATFLVDTSGSFRMNLYLTEDEVTGTGTGYDQVNYYNSTSGSPLFGLGNPIVNYVHNHVLREAMGSAWGTPGVIPATVHAGEEYTRTYTKTIPATWDITKMHIIGMVNLFAGQLIYQRPTLNAEEAPFSIATGITSGPGANSNTMEIYPNPMSDRTTVTFSIEEMGNVKVEVFSITGQLVRSLANDVTNSGIHSVYWDGKDQAGNLSANGLYIVRMATESGAAISKRVMLSR
jgi:hypothetical protein